jgi:outer membrane lipoprotein-sorting protein
MKMLKKIAAAIMAVAMATLMLTACGEDSAPSYRLQKIVEANQKSGKIYADMTLVTDKGASANYVYAINGQNMYAKIQVTADYSMEVVVKDGKGYRKQAGQWVEAPNMGESLKQGSTAITPVAGNIVVAPEYKIEATGETMYAETIVSNGQEIAYCFNGDKLAYIVTTAEGQKITLKVNKWENNYDQAIQDKLDLKA